MAADPAYFSRDHHHFSYFGRGRYAAQLSGWLEHYPSTRLLLVESQDLYEHPEACLASVTDFLGLRRWTPHEFRNYSYVGKPPRRLAVDPGLRSELRARYAADDARLAELWGRRPSWCEGS